MNLGLPDAELVPLKSSRNVVLALSNEEINYGVMAIENSIGELLRKASIRKRQLTDFWLT